MIWTPQRLPPTGAEFAARANRELFAAKPKASLQDNKWWQDGADLTQGVDFVVIDSATDDREELLKAKGIDMMVIPCRPSMLDVNPTQLAVLCSRSARRPPYVVFNGVLPNSHVPNEIRAELVKVGAWVAPHQLTQRAAFAHSIAAGQTVLESEPSSKAAKEIQALYSWMSAILDMPPKEISISLNRGIPFTIIFDAITQTDDACSHGVLATESDGD